MPPRSRPAPPRSVVEDLLRQVDDLYRLPTDGDPDQWTAAADHWSGLPQSDRDLAEMHIGLLQLVALGRLGASIERLRVDLVKRLDELVDLAEEVVDGDAPDEGLEEEEEPVEEEPVEEEPPPAPAPTPTPKPASKRERERKPAKAESVTAEVVEPPPSASAKADTAAFAHPVPR